MRVTYLIDGFNLYHSLITAYYEQNIQALIQKNNLNFNSLKWLNLHSLFSSYNYLIDKNATLESIHYFSAYAYHLKNKLKIIRHKNYIDCLEHTGVITHIARFKSKKIKCPHCSSIIDRYEEKETDVDIAAMLFRLTLLDEYDVAVIVTGDTDLAPSFRLIHNHYQTKKVWSAFPFKRHNHELKSLADDHYNISAESYLKHQFPSKVKISNSKYIDRPSCW